MRVACWITKSTHTQNMQYLLLPHSNNDYANAAYTYISCLVYRFPQSVVVMDVQGVH